MTLRNLQDLYVEKLRDVYDAEKRIVRALPKMIKAVDSEELSAAFQDHLQVTEGHVERLERIFASMDKPASRKTCHAMMGLLEEGEELMKEEGAEAVLDAGLIAAAQSVEHYEMAAYGCLKTWAGMLGRNEDARMHEQTLGEEKEADEKLTEVAQSINPEAKSGEDVEDDESEERDFAHAGSPSRSNSSMRSGSGSRSTSGGKSSSGSKKKSGSR